MALGSASCGAHPGGVSHVASVAWAEGSRSAATCKAGIGMSCGWVGVAGGRECGVRCSRVACNSVTFVLAWQEGVRI